MLSYRHGYHAGNWADVLKHAVYAFCLAYLKAKPKPFFVIDSHAGAGIYDLAGPMAARLGEWREGIARVWQAPSPPVLFAEYLAVLADLNPEGRLVRYPGSPELARRLLRPGDRLQLSELHPTDHASLAASHRGVRKTDGFQALVAAMPPKERRGIALVDPSYEIKDDFDHVVDAVAAAHRRFSTGTFVVWYPVVERERTELMVERFVTSRIRAQYRIELGLRPDSADRGMTASGLIVINPPWTLPEAVGAALPWLAAHLGAGGPVGADWLVGE